MNLKPYVVTDERRQELEEKEKERLSKQEFKQRAEDTNLLVMYLRELPEGALATYTELTKCIGKDVRPDREGYSSMIAALHIVRRQHNKTFDNIPTKGYKHCTTEEEFKNIANRERRGIKHKCTVALSKLNNAKDFENFTKEGKQELNVNRTIFSLQRNIASGNNIDKIRMITTEKQKTISPMDTLKKLLGMKEEKMEDVEPDLT